MFQYPDRSRRLVELAGDTWTADSLRLLGFARLALGFLGASVKGLYTFIIIKFSTS